MAEHMWTKFSKYWSDIHVLLIVVVVLDPAYKIELIDFYHVKFGGSDLTLDPENVKASVYEVVREYELKQKTKLDESSSSGNALG